MAEHVIKMPDVGEGVAEAELVEWNVKVGDLVREDTVIAAVMTDKATVEIPSPVEGQIAWLGAEIGDTVAVGSPIVKIDVAGDAAASTEPTDETPEVKSKAVAAEPEAKPAKAEPVAPPATEKKPAPASVKSTAAGPTPTGAPRPEGERPLASPAVRLRAKEAGIDLRQVPGTGPAGRISHEDLDVFIARGREPVVTGLRPDTSVEEIKVVGLRRRIAEKMALAKSRIPHITYVEEVDVTALEDLRASLNATKRPDRAKLTLLPFLMRAMVKAIAEQPQLNALYDDEAGVIHRHGGVHIGIAAQTPSGLVVPVVRHAEARDLWDSAAEVNRLADAAKAGTATREELSGSTITITSLGAMGGVATTPVINHPEVAIIGVNKMMVRPVWDGSQFIPRKMMNLSSSFDHRVIDGWDAAVFVQRIKALLETPALIFVGD
ncbi:dihydrolipoamide acetyltransferase family protein [Neoaquamicrobium sediminum]|uniref:Dihydrolipoamide acetyltransferase component of pyruvate dehydrogenase complex n=1 Tax=Neoaquamicrobium sediminum TaxID=1849104 RepID=A0ABV3WZF8_9HYPH